MPTVVFRYLTRDGFIIVADGKVYDPRKDATESTTAQKIFEIPDRPAAYALYGNIRFDDDTDETKSVNLAAEIEKFVFSGAAKPDDLLIYGQQVAEPLYLRLLKAQADGHVIDFQGFNEFPANGTTIARIFLFGYCDGAPCEVDIRLWYRDQTLERPQVNAFDIRQRNPRPWGSPVVWNALVGNDPKLSRFLRMPPPKQSQEISLWDAAKVGEAYILACDSDHGREIDSGCKAIGGHIHIAAITPKCFHWLRPPARDSSDMAA